VGRAGHAPVCCPNAVHSQPLKSGILAGERPGTPAAQRVCTGRGSLPQKESHALYPCTHGCALLQQPPDRVSMHLTLFRPDAAHRHRDGPVQGAGRARRGATCCVPEDLLRHRPGRPPHPCHEAGAHGRQRCALGAGWRPCCARSHRLAGSAPAGTEPCAVSQLPWTLL